MITKQQLSLILEFASEAHKTQLRRGSNLPYISHPIAVAQIILDKHSDILNDYSANILMAIAYLHDVPEDTEYNLEQIYAYLISIDLSIDDATFITARVRDLTKETENFDIIKYLSKIRESSFSTMVKLADLEHNLSDLKPGSLRDKYLLCKWFLEQ